MFAHSPSFQSEAKQKPAPTCKEAIAKWQAKTKENPTEATKVLLIAMFIKKMDSALNTLVNCEYVPLAPLYICATSLLSPTLLSRFSISSIIPRLFPCYDHSPSVLPYLQTPGSIFKLYRQNSSTSRVKTAKNLVIGSKPDS